MNTTSSNIVKNNLDKNTSLLIEQLHNFCYISNENDVTLNFKSLKIINKQLQTILKWKH